MRLEKIKIIREKLRNGQVTIGTWQQIPHSSISEILGQANYDWVAVDMEHGSISINQLNDLFRAIELGGTLPMVRISESTSKGSKQALDAGAGGIIVPMIESGDQLKKIKDASCWPPTGNRGVGFSRANLFGKHFNEYIIEAQAPLLVAQIEHINAVKNLADILQIEGLDAIIVGPYDLSASMGITAEFEHKEFLAAMDQIMKLCLQHNVPSGYHVVEPDPKLLEKRIKEGHRFLAYSIDAVFLYKSGTNPVFK